MISKPIPTTPPASRPLHSTMFCIVDLETTGTSSAAEITEIGAVKVCGGEVMEEFQTLVKPENPIPARIQELTEITDAMVAEAPSAALAVPRFLEFAAGCVLVAHNAPFDLGFLRRAALRHGLVWPRVTVVDTVTLARRLVRPTAVRNYKLSTLAAYFRTATQPDHRALSDAHATVGVLQQLLERSGLDTVEELQVLLQDW